MNGGFESAGSGSGSGTDFYSVGDSIDGGNWFVTSGVIGVDSFNSFVYSGNVSVLLTGSELPNSLTQTLNTTNGHIYNVSFCGNADTSNAFSITFGGLMVNGLPTAITANGFPSTDTNSALFQCYTGTVVARSNVSELVLSATDLQGGPGSSVEIDDVQAIDTSAPEPSTVTGCLTGGAIVVARWVRARRKKGPFLCAAID